jgi:hypothetical protein
MEYTNEIKRLRARIPIGINRAEKLLLETRGDVLLAERIFTESMVRLFMEKELPDRDRAVSYLEQTNYDLGAALRKSESDRYSITELCLRKNCKKEDALDKILCAMETKYNYSFWLCWEKKDIPPLNTSEYTFVVIMEWINYESWEGDLVISERIAKACRELNFNELADLLDRVISRKKKVETIWEDRFYRLLERVFLRRKADLTERLYEFVKERIRDFP